MKNEDIDIKSTFLEFLESFHNILFNEKFDDEVDSIYALESGLTMMSNILMTLKLSLDEFGEFSSNETAYIEIDDKKNKKILRKRFPFLHKFYFDMEIHNEDYEPMSDDFDAAEELAFLARIILQTINIVKKYDINEAVVFYIFSMDMGGLTPLYMLLLYIQNVKPEFDFEELLDEEDESTEVNKVFKIGK